MDGIYGIYGNNINPSQNVLQLESQKQRYAGRGRIAAGCSKKFQTGPFEQTPHDLKLKMGPRARPKRLQIGARNQVSVQKVLFKFSWI